LQSGGKKRGFGRDFLSYPGVNRRAFGNTANTFNVLTLKKNKNKKKTNKQKNNKNNPK